MGYGDFYDEPSEFEQQIEEFKNSLLGAVKKQYLAEMDELKKENLRLQDIKDSFEQIQLDYIMDSERLDLAIRNAEIEARKNRLTELMGDFKATMFQAERTYTEKPKCSKCDDNRQIKFLSPQGYELRENCECSTKDCFWKPFSHSVHEFRIDKYNNKMLLWYKIDSSSNSSDEYGIRASSNFGEQTYKKDMKHEDIKSNYTYFENIEDCQKYCDWLNKQ